MRGLLGAFLLAPALATALVVPEIEVEEFKGEVARPSLDRVFAHIGVPVPSGAQQSPDEERIFVFKLEVLNSEEACGFGNVTLDGQVLPQTLEGDVSSGKGSVTTTRKSIVVGSWSFYCIRVNGVPDSQLMKFAVDAVDGEAVQDVGFSVLFRQSGPTEIMNIETDLSIPDQVVGNPDPEALQPAHDMEPHPSMEQELAELDYLWSQLREIKYLIHEKERSIARHSRHQQATSLKDCDSLKCVVKAVADHARHAAHELYGKVRGEFDEEEFDQFGKPHFKHPKFPHFKHPKGGKNHTCGPPKHGKGNHTLPHPPPHHKLPLPICRYPPPPSFFHHHGPPPPFFHHGFPHGKPPGGPDEEFYHGHGPEDRPHWIPHHNMPPPPDFDAPPPRNHWKHPPPPEDAPEFNGPDFDGPPPHRHDERPDFDGPERHHGQPDFDEPDFDAPPPHRHEGPGHDRPHGHEEHPDFEGPRHHQGPPDFDHPPPPPHHGDHPPPPPPEFAHEQGHVGGPEDEFRTHHEGPGGPPPPFDGPGPHGPPRNGLGKALQIVKFTAIGFLCAFLLLALHRRNCTPKRRADRQARKEERARRRAYRRAAHKHMITRLLARISGNGEETDDEDYEEKRERLLSDAEDGMSTTMSEDIREMRTTADVVDEMVIADSNANLHSSSPSPISSIETIPVSETRPLIQDFDSMSQVGDVNEHGEELPAYEDHDGSEDSSVIADGFRYTPGSSNYTPGHSPAGSVSDILGPDTKN
ncbi:uncharacterized protein PAC_16633 [Phialocephala subalpina]|uniref:Uncharacterized protein n=1 Tax=Phialocephala subalpina TaxID=576137 RepID=A0A1L7XNY8_9HELO|nr:uncharacterized protein PAC_16633 [Phialocephala subalpina]